MKKLNKILSVGLSLVLCASMTVPAFAASFTDLQDAINSKPAGENADSHANGTKISAENEPERYGYGWNEAANEGKGQWGIEAWDDEETGRNVKLYEDVEREKRTDDAINSITVTDGKNVKLDLNGNNIIGNKTSTATVTVQGKDSFLTLTDTSEEKGGAIVGGGQDVNYAGGVTIDDGASFIMDGGKITDVASGIASVHVKDGTFQMNDGTISGGYRPGVVVEGADSQFTMDGGAISDKKLGGIAGGVLVKEGATFTMNDGNITNNVTNVLGGGVRVVNGNFTMYGGNVSGNSSTGIYIEGNSTVNLSAKEAGGIHISENTGGHGGGIHYNASEGYNLIIKGVVMEKNVAGGMGGAVFAQGGGTVTIEDTIMRDNKAQDGMAVRAHSRVDIIGGTVENTTENRGFALSKHPNGGDLRIKDTTLINCRVISPGGDGMSVQNIHSVGNTSCILDGSGSFKIDGITITRTGEGGKTVTITDAGGNRLTAVQDVNGKVLDASQLLETHIELTAPLSCAHGGSTATTQENEVAAQPGVNGSYDEVVHCSECGEEISRTTVVISALPVPENVDLGEEPDDEVEIEDPEVPLAGLFTRADAIGYLWEQTGSPDAELSDFPDVPEDHYWAVAIGWAQDMGIALPDEEGNFRPDDLVLRSSSEPEGELQQFLNRYAVFAGAAEQGESFIQLTGASDDIIMGEEAQVIFDEFFAKLEAALTRKAA